MNSVVLRLVLSRLGVALLTLLIVSFVVFGATQMLPGDVAEILLGQAATPEAVAALRSAMHLDQPAIVQYAHWLAGLAQGDLGTSYANDLPVAQLIGGRLVNTLRLAAVTAVIAVPLALTLGITCAMYRGSLYDRLVSGAVIGVISVPEFMIAPALNTAWPRVSVLWAMRSSPKLQISPPNLAKP